MELFSLVLILAVFAQTVSPQITSKTSLQIVEDFKAVIDVRREEHMAVINALLRVISVTQDLFRDTGLEIGNRLTNEYFLEGTQALQGTADFIRLRDVFVAVSTENTLINMPTEGRSFYKTCLDQHSEIAALRFVESDLVEAGIKLVNAVVSNKVKADACILMNPEQAPECVANVSAKNPLPQVNQSVVNGLSLIKHNWNCIDGAADMLRTRGQLCVESVRKVYPKDALFMVPEKYDFLEGRVFGEPSMIVTPDEKLAEAKAALALARTNLQMAWDAKNTNFNSAKSYLNRLFDDLNRNLANVSIQPDSAACLIAAKANTIGNQNNQGVALLVCIGNVQAAPTPQELCSLELSLIDRETKENAGSSTINCFKSLRNVFFPSEMKCCMSEAQNDYKDFLESITIKAKMFAKRASEIILQFEQCKVTSLQLSKQAFFGEAGAFEKCVKMNTKVTLTSLAPYPFVDTPY